MKLIIQWDEGEKATPESESMLEEIAHYFNTCFQLIIRKSGPYGAAWRDQGYMGQTSRILSKTARLRNLVWREDELQNSEETTVDTVRDLVNLCIFWLINKDHSRKWGRSRDE